MKKFRLLPESYFSSELLPRSFDRVEDAYKYAKEHKLIPHCYLLQREDDENDDIRISMQEIADVFEDGEAPEDLYFF